MCWKASLYVSVSQSSLGLPGRLLSIERGRSPSAANVTWFKGSALLLLSMCPRSFNFFLLQVSPKGSKWHPCSCLISSYIFRLVCSRSMKVGGFLRIRRNVLFWKALSLEISFWVSCIHSKPYSSFDLMIAVNTWIFHLIEVLALSQNSFKRRHVAMQSPILLRISALLSKESVKRVPRYTADFLLGTNAPLPVLLVQNAQSFVAGWRSDWRIYHN